MLCQVHTIVKHAGDFQAVAEGDSVKEEVAGFVDASDGSAHVVSAVAKVVRESAIRQLRTFLGPDAARVVRKIQNRLRQ